MFLIVDKYHNLAHEKETDLHGTAAICKIIMSSIQHIWQFNQPTLVSDALIVEFYKGMYFHRYFIKATGTYLNVSYPFSCKVFKYGYGNQMKRL